MSDFFRYEDLTWPEIAGLPRSTPLVIPLGEGYAWGTLVEALGSPARIGLLPAIPFGWNGSRLPVPDALISAVVRNLLAGLRDDGFSRVYALLPQGLDLDLGSQGLAQEAGNRLQPTLPLPSDADRSKVILLPIGHTEQHAYHLPMNTDTLIIDAIARGTAEQASEQAAILPVMPYGVSTHRSAFAGTLNCGGRAFEDFWLAVIEALVRRGFNRFYFLSGHGGNGSFINNVVKYAGERFHQAFTAAAWLYLSGPEGVAALEAHRQSPIGGMGHAGELETSLVLLLRPDLVHMERVVDELNFITTPSYYMDWMEGGALIANPPWEDDTFTGAYGAGSLGTAQKGALWLQAAIDEKISHVGEIHEQYTRRTQKRSDRRNNIAGV
jgi:creatinine amidohydrolase